MESLTPAGGLKLPAPPWFVPLPTLGFLPVSSAPAKTVESIKKKGPVISCRAFLESYHFGGTLGGQPLQGFQFLLVDLNRYGHCLCQR